MIYRRLTDGLWATWDEYKNITQVRVELGSLMRAGGAQRWLDEVMTPHKVELCWFKDDETYDYAAVTRVFEWTVKFRVSPTWVMDGFNLDNERAHRMLCEHLPYAYGHELSAEVLSAPDPRSIRKEQGG